MKRLTTIDVLVLLAVISVSSFNPVFLPLDREHRSLLKASHSIVEDKKALSRRERKKLEKKQDYERRRTVWMERYGTFQALQSTFGAGSICGDLSPEQTRRLYHTLLPRSLLGLYEMGLMKPEELAPLAYNARIAAKKYARSRCIWTGRVATFAFDQYRNLRDKGKFGSSSMTWEEIWQKYEAQIVEEECADELSGRRRRKNEETLTMRIYLRILERSCATNQAFDNLFLQGDSDQMTEIASKLQYDVREVLLGPNENAKAMRKAQKIEKKQQEAAKKEGKRQRKAERNKQKDERKDEKQSMHREGKEEAEIITAGAEKNVTVSTVSRRWEVLRILAGTRRKFRQMQGGK